MPRGRGRTVISTRVPRPASLWISQRPPMPARRFSKLARPAPDEGDPRQGRHPAGVIRREALAVVFHHERETFRLDPQPQPDFRGAGVLDDVVQRLLQRQEQIVAQTRRPPAPPAASPANPCGSGCPPRAKNPRRRRKCNPSNRPTCRAADPRPRRFRPSPASVCARNRKCGRDARRVCSGSRRASSVSSVICVSPAPMSSWMSLAMRARSRSTACCCSSRARRRRYLAVAIRRTAKATPPRTQMPTSIWNHSV